MYNSVVAANHESSTQPQNANSSVCLYRDEPVRNNQRPDKDLGIRGPNNWQNTLASRIAYLFNNETLSDVIFLVGTNEVIQRIPAHNCVFDAMFNGNLSQVNQEPIRVSDIEPCAFLTLLRFLYTDEIQIDPESVMTVLYVSKKYTITALEKACVDFLQTNLCCDNAFMLLSQARLFDEPDLSSLCLDIIDKNANEAFSSDCFNEIDYDTLCLVLSRDSLVITEILLFHFVIQWANSECIRQGLTKTPENLRKVLGDSLKLIRFPLMTIDEFSTEVAQSCLLDDKGLVEMFLYFTLKSKPEVQYTSKPRLEIQSLNIEQVLSRFSNYESRWGYNGVSDRIRLSVNRKIKILGFGLYGSIQGSSEYSVILKIVHSKNLKVLAEDEITFISDGTPSINRVLFKSPIEIQKDTTYTISCTIKGPDSYYGIRGLHKIVHDTVHNGKVTFTFTYTAGHNNGTSVTDGQIPQIYFNIP